MATVFDVAELVGPTLVEELAGDLEVREKAPKLRTPPNLKDSLKKAQEALKKSQKEAKKKQKGEKTKIEKELEKKLPTDISKIIKDMAGVSEEDKLFTNLIDFVKRTSVNTKNLDKLLGQYNIGIDKVEGKKTKKDKAKAIAQYLIDNKIVSNLQNYESFKKDFKNTIENIKIKEKFDEELRKSYIENFNNLEEKDLSNFNLQELKNLATDVNLDFNPDIGIDELKTKLLVEITKRNERMKQIEQQEQEQQEQKQKEQQDEIGAEEEDEIGVEEEKDGGIIITDRTNTKRQTTTPQFETQQVQELESSVVNLPSGAPALRPAFEIAGGDIVPELTEKQVELENVNEFSIFETGLDQTEELSNPIYVSNENNDKLQDRNSDFIDNQYLMDEIINTDFNLPKGYRTNKIGFYNKKNKSIKFLNSFGNDLSYFPLESVIPLGYENFKDEFTPADFLMKDDFKSVIFTH